MVNISFFGDISLYNIDVSSFTFCEKYHRIINDTDIVVGNLECPISSASEKEKYQAKNMVAHETSLDLLKGFDVVSIANNHIRDYQDDGIFDTINALKRKGIKFFGAGKTQDDALNPIFIEKEKVKLAIFGATRYANAGKKTGWGTAPDNSRRLYNEIRKLNQKGYFIILYFHWGYEYVRIPSPRERTIAHKCIDAGADLIIGAHPHIYQGIEDYKGKKIVYSLGNFIFHSSVFKGLAPFENDTRLNESFIFSVDVNPDYTYTTTIIGYNTTDVGIRLYDDFENNKLISEIQGHSEILKSAYIKYFKAYYGQSMQIAKQNIKVRKTFQRIDKLSFTEKLKLYKTANFQDIKNRIAGIFLSIINSKQDYEKASTF